STRSARCNVTRFCTNGSDPVVESVNGEFRVTIWANGRSKPQLALISRHFSVASIAGLKRFYLLTGGPLHEDPLKSKPVEAAVRQLLQLNTKNDPVWHFDRVGA
ncbi:MAG: hypothetical protein AAFO17_13475, partial [Pseudomonadota bacterium]